MYRIFHERHKSSYVPQPFRNPQPCGRQKTMPTKSISWQPWSAWVWCASTWSTAPSPRSTRWDLDQDEGWKQKPCDLFRDIFSSHPLGYQTRVSRWICTIFGSTFKIHGATVFGKFLGFANFNPPQWPWKSPAFDAPGPLTQAVAAGALGAPDPGRWSEVCSQGHQGGDRQNPRIQRMTTNGLSRIWQDDHSRMIQQVG